MSSHDTPSETCAGCACFWIGWLHGWDISPFPVGVLSNNEEINFISKGSPQIISKLQKKYSPRQIGLSCNAEKFHILRRIFPMFKWGSPGMTSYNAQKGNLFPRSRPQCIIGQLKQGGINSRKGNQGVSHPDFWICLFLEREFCQICRRRAAGHI